MNILEFKVAEFTRINEGLNRVCLDGGFADSKTRVVFNTREKFKVGQLLTVQDAPPVMAPPTVAPPERAGQEGRVCPGQGEEEELLLLRA